MTDRRAAAWIDRFNEALEEGDPRDVASLFGEECYWRDLLAFTWNVKTMHGRDAIESMLDATLARLRPIRFEPAETPRETSEWIEVVLSFETPVARGTGHLRLKDGRAYTLLTTTDSLRGFEEPSGSLRPNGVAHGAVFGRSTWAEDRERHVRSLGATRQPYALIVGGGQGGIALGARLRRLGVPTLIVERRQRPGDSWRSRYRTLVLHDPVWYDHMPYLPFPDDWPVFTPKDKMGDWLEAYTRIMELDYWGSTECLGARFDEACGEWSVEVEREGERTTLRPRQLVLATGAYGPPRVPEIDGAERFSGTVMHSSDYRSGEAWSGKRCVVIGSNTSAHDICVDLWECGAGKVTMVQRSSTLVVRSETLMDLGFRALYSEEALARGITTERADLEFASLPLALMAERNKEVTRLMEERDADLLRRLVERGFRLDSGVDGSGLMMKAFRTGSGYYIDVGGSELIAEGSVAVRSGVEPTGFESDAVRLSDGAAVPADLVVYATGYLTAQQTVADLIGEETASRIGHCWGYGSGTPGDPGPWEGELRNLWKPLAQEALWIHGGNLHLSRFYSRFVALQIKARMEGIPTPVYGAPSNSDRAESGYANG